MTIAALRDFFLGQSASGTIFVDAKAFTDSGLAAPPGLDALQGAAFGAARLPIATSPDGIGPLQGDAFTVTGTIDVLIAPGKPIAIVFSAAGTQGALLSEIALGEGWTFGASFARLNGATFNALPLTGGTFFFTPVAARQPFTGSVIDLGPGLNFAGRISISAVLAPVAQVFPEMPLAPSYVLSGTVDPTPTPANATPILSLATEPLATGTFPIAAWSFLDPRVTITTIPIPTPDGVNMTAQVAFSAGLRVPGLAARPLVTAALDANTSRSVTLTLTEAGEGLLLTSAQLFDLMAGQTTFAVIPPPLTAVMQNVGLRSLQIQVDLEGPSVGSITALLGAREPFVVSTSPSLTLDPVLAWTIAAPLTSEQRVTGNITATAEFLPHLFRGLFLFQIGRGGVVTGSFTAGRSAGISLKAVLSEIAGQAVSAPFDIVLEQFVVSFDEPNRRFSIAAGTSSSLPLLPGGKLSLAGVNLHLAVQKAAGGAAQTSADIASALVIGTTWLTVSGSFDAGRWTFGMSTPAGAQVTLQDLIDRVFSTLSLPVELFPLDTLVSDLSIEAVTPADPSKATTYTASARVRWQFALGGSSIDTVAQLTLAYDSSRSPAFSGAVAAAATLSIFGLGAELELGYRFESVSGAASKTLSLAWQGLTAEFVTGGAASIVRFTAGEGWNLGRLINAVIQLLDPNASTTLPPPWDELNGLSLAGLTIELNLSTGEVKATLPVRIELAFGTITGFTVSRPPGGAPNVSITGDFLFTSSKEASWNPLTSGPPEVPGGGLGAFDLRLLALGQRVTLPGLAGIRSVAEAVDALAHVPPTEAGTSVVPIGLPGQPVYAADGGWLIAAHFRALDGTIDVKVLFNDPQLYGIAISLAGPKAKIFAGLQFEILYKQVGGGVGLYRVELQLPDRMRYLEFGAISLILPAVAVEIYTNGDFLLDFGFPHDMDFSRSFTVQAFPFTGSGGFYFGVLGGVTSTQVPLAPCGTFEPVLVFGLGLRVGLGKIISYGIFRAEVSVTVFGMLEGVVAAWNGYAAPPLLGSGNDVQSTYFYRVAGTLGIIGRISAVIDFAVIRAELNIVVYAYVQGTFEAYRATHVAIEAGISVSLELTLDFGLFTISFSLSFSIHVRESFTIGSDRLSEAPWFCDGRTHFPRSLASRPRPALPGPDAVTPDFAPLAPPATKPVLTVFALPQLSVAATTTPPTLKDQTAVYSVNLFIAKAGFTELALDTFLWIVSSFSGNPVKSTPAGELAKVTTREQVSAALAWLAANADGRALTYAQIAANLGNLVVLNIVAPRDSFTRPATVAFPMPPGMVMNAADNRKTLQITVDFNTFSTVDAAYLAKLAEMIDRLTAGLLTELEKDNSDVLGGLDPLRTAADPPPQSLAQFVFIDYFVMIARALLQAAADAFEEYALTPAAGDSLASIAAQFNGIPGSGNGLTAEAIARTNRDVPVAASLRLTIGDVPFPIPTGKTLGQIAAAFGLTAGAVAAANAAVPMVLIPGTAVTVGGVTQNVPAEGSFDSLAALFPGITAAQLGTDLAAVPDLLSPLTVLTLDGIGYTTAAGDTLAGIAARFGITIDVLARSVAPVVGLFGAARILLPELDGLTNSLLWSTIVSTGGADQAAGMVSRFLLGGLRLPTAGIVNGPRITAARAGLQRLTGQLFAIPALRSGDSLTITLTATPAVPWITPATATVTAASAQVSQIDDVLRKARADGIRPAIEALGQLPAAAKRPRQFAFAGDIVVQSAETIPLPAGNDGLPPGSARQPRLFQFPPALMEETARKTAVAPLFGIHYGSPASEGSRVAAAAAKAYAFGTLVNVSLRRRIEGTDPGSAMSPVTYELIGAAQPGVLLLERLMSALGRRGDLIDGIYVLYQPNPTSGRAEGLQYDGESRYTAFLVRANLSTETRPAGPPLPDAVTGFLNGGADFVTTLWSASVTRSGGTYFVYDLGDGTGLPDSLFEDDGAGDVAFLIVYKPQDGFTGAAGNVAFDFMNVVLIDDPIDVESSVVFAESRKRRVTASTAQTLEQIAATHHLGLIDIAAANARERLRSSLLDVTDIVHQVARGQDLTAIGALYGVPTASIVAANPNVPGPPYPAGTGLHIPDTKRPAGEDLASMAATYSTTVAALAWANRGVSGLFGRPIITFDDELLDDLALMRPGNAGIGLTRTPPPPAGIRDRLRPEPYLLQQYNLLGYEFVDTNDFVAVPDALALPAGPAKDVDDPRTRDAGQWQYTLVVPAAPSARNNPIPAGPTFPPASQNPYAGAGGFVQLAIDWRDMFGEKAWTPFDDPSPTNRYPLPRPAARVGFNDQVLGLSLWPSTTAKHFFTGSGSPVLHIEWAFDTSRYEETNPARRTNASSDQQVFATIYYQLLQTSPGGKPATNISTVTTLGGESPVTAAERDSAVGYVLGAWRYLQRILEDGLGIDPPAPVRLARAISASAIAGITPIDAAVRFSRIDAVVLAEFRDDPAVMSSVTVVPPRLEEAAGGALSLDAYAAAFEAAFDFAGVRYRTATGTSRLDSPAPEATLWAVPFGKTASVSYSASLREPAAFFAPAPLSTRLLSRENVSLYTYSAETGLSAAPDLLQSFSGVDLDVWARSALSLIDELLSPQLAPAVLLLDTIGANAFVPMLTAVKRELAEAVSSGLTNVLETPALDPVTDAARFAAARAKMREQLLVRLGNAYDVDVLIQYAMDVAAPPASPATAPRLYGSAAGGGIDANDFSIGTFSIPLTPGTSMLTYALNARVAEFDKHLAATLQYLPTHIEHEIAPAAAGNPPASSWLKFIHPLPLIALSGTPSKTSFPIDIPIPLRAYPTPPVMRRQTFLPADPVDALTVQKAKEWTFRFTYAVGHAAQDRIDAGILLNVPKGGTPPASAPADSPDLFTMLARIELVLDGLMAVLRTDLPAITPATAVTDPLFTRAAAALAAVATLTNGLAPAWASWIAARDAGVPFGPTDGPSDVPFAILEDRIDFEGFDDVFRATVLYEPSTLPPGAAPPLLTFAGYDPEPVDPLVDSEAVLAVLRLLGPDRAGGPEAIVAAAHVYRRVGVEPPVYLTIQEAFAIPDRHTELGVLDALVIQNAWASVRITRNLELVADNPTRGVFIYQTPVVRFASKLTPLLDTDRPIEIAAIPSGRPVSRTLLEHLEALFTAFLEGTTTPPVIQIETSYAYTLEPDREAFRIDLPIVMLPATTGVPIPAIRDALATWMTTNVPARTNGELRLDVSAYSSLSDDRLPIVRVRRLRLGIDFVTDL